MAAAALWRSDVISSLLQAVTPPTSTRTHTHTHTHTHTLARTHTHTHCCYCCSSAPPTPTVPPPSPPPPYTHPSLFHSFSLSSSPRAPPPPPFPFSPRAALGVCCQGRAADGAQTPGPADCKRPPRFLDTSHAALRDERDWTFFRPLGAIPRAPGAAPLGAAADFLPPRFREITPTPPAPRPLPYTPPTLHCFVRPCDRSFALREASGT